MILMEYFFSSVSEFSESEIRSIEAMLPESERIRLSSKPQEKYIHSIAVRVLLKLQLNNLGYEVSSFCVTNSSSGKPILNSPKGLNISLTHSHDMVGCAFSEKRVGIDIQKITACSEKAILRICTPEEVEFIQKGNRVDSFIIWTLKESYLKATSCSFSQMVQTSFVKNGRISAPDDVSKTEYGFKGDYAWSVIEI